MLSVFLLVPFLFAQFLRTLSIVCQPRLLFMALLGRKRLPILHYQQACRSVASFNYELGLRKLRRALFILESEMHARTLIRGDFIVHSSANNFSQ